MDGNTLLPQLLLCKKIEDDKEYWESLNSFELTYSKKTISHKIFLYQHSGHWHLNWKFSPNSKKCVAFLKSANFPKTNQVWNFSNSVWKFYDDKNWNKGKLVCVECPV